MPEETVDFKMDVSDENIKREAMKIVWMFSGVTFVDIKEKGILKVRGKFDKIEIGRKLHELDKSVDIINPLGKPGQYRIPSLTTVYSYFTPKIQEVVVFKFKVLDEKLKRDAMKVIWEFSGITSVEVKRVDRLEVKGGEFNKIAMSTKLKGIDESVSVFIKAGPDGQVDVTNFNTNSLRTTLRVPAPVPIRVPAPAPPPAPAPEPVSAYAHKRLHVPVKTSIWTRCFRPISRRLCP
ncbi:unnamed protein product [Arabidopsis lyrata]|uniref:Predicted protein n=1 Tax=Arabidopsis lyrata subsp. lyrata TaxID=81972 RepID=D7MS76_ARALL|nr:uncharacterized protein LOC9300264 [Arabidopsis lyrata subsp. lyrata]EFH40447.1 predicted protein [Arabidopsis lyrata subsp. lyrata]CAH8279400.1 unnamed protein product [Arabidopsis lyrata]|eukprot:XP_002864188.1 uncharacterized protein LOC9300264 [Arabidopsis lyrata subsp. lyrata]